MILSGADTSFYAVFHVGTMVSHVLPELDQVTVGPHESHESLMCPSASHIACKHTSFFSPMQLSAQTVIIYNVEGCSNCIPLFEVVID